jgi:GNAT superfamily N-acetyltransferase
MPLTASTALAARIDRAELSMVLGMADAMRASGSDVRTWPIGGSVAVLSDADSPFNKLIGLGFAGVPDLDALAEIERVHRARGVRLQVELATLAAPAVGRLLTARGYRLEGFENVLARRLVDVTELTPGPVAVSEAGEEETDGWIAAMIEAFRRPDVFDGPESHESFDRATLERAYRCFAAVPGTSRLVARMDGAVAGGASLYMATGVALFCGAGTRPESRRKGVQSSLLWSRLARARDAGCDLAVVTTQPGSKSQANVQKAGFDLIYSRAILVKE